MKSSGGGSCKIKFWVLDIFHKPYGKNWGKQECHAPDGGLQSFHWCMFVRKKWEPQLVQGSSMMNKTLPQSPISKNWTKIISSCPNKKTYQSPWLFNLFLLWIISLLSPPHPQSWVNLWWNKGTYIFLFWHKKFTSYPSFSTTVPSPTKKIPTPNNEHLDLD